MTIYCRPGPSYSGQSFSELFGRKLIIEGNLAAQSNSIDSYAHFLDINSVKEDGEKSVNHLVLGVECVRLHNKGQYFCNHYRKSKPPLSIIAKTNETLELGQFYTLAGSWHIWKNYLTGKEKSEMHVESVRTLDKKDGPGVRELLQMAGNGSHTMYESIDDVLEDQYMLYTNERKKYFRDCLVVAGVLLREVCG